MFIYSSVSQVLLMPPKYFPPWTADLKHCISFPVRASHRSHQTSFPREHLSILLHKSTCSSIFPSLSLPLSLRNPSTRIMGAAASMPAARAGAWQEGITHGQRVTRLYRASLRTARDWLIDTDAWIEECINIQSRFRVNKDKSITEGRFLVEKGMEELLSRRHPEPYVPIYMPGGSSYQRNVPPPPELAEKSMPPPDKCIQ